MQAGEVMESNNKMVNIISEGKAMSKESVTLHIGYNESLTLKELSDILDSINKAINDINRENGIKNNAKLGKEYATEVTGVDSGSIVIHILTTFVTPVALGVLGNFLYDRLKSIGAKKEKNQIITETAYPIFINVNGDDNLIELNITKLSNSSEIK